MNSRITFFVSIFAILFLLLTFYGDAYPLLSSNADAAEQSIRESGDDLSSGKEKTLSQEQNRYPRVRSARRANENKIKDLFRSKNVAYPPGGIILIVYKIDRILQLWAEKETGKPYVHMKDYKICSISGLPGPKRREGDLQIPEGFYRVIDFNPWSNFHLSMKIDYPNRSDRILGYRPSLGGLIFIHGSCVTIGCIPITDESIKELYIIVVDTESKTGIKIPVYIFPAMMEDERMGDLYNYTSGNEPLRKFWENLAQGYRLFKASKRPLNISIDSTGKYIFR